ELALALRAIAFRDRKAAGCRRGVTASFLNRNQSKILSINDRAIDRVDFVGSICFDCGKPESQVGFVAAGKRARLARHSRNAGSPNHWDRRLYHLPENVDLHHKLGESRSWKQTDLVKDNPVNGRLRWRIRSGPHALSKPSRYID